MARRPVAPLGVAAAAQAAIDSLGANDYFETAELLEHVLNFSTALNDADREEAIQWLDRKVDMRY